MTFTATPQPSNIPPRVLLELDSGNPATPYTSIAIKRDGALIREQPFVSGSTALTYDYEAPFGVAVTYAVEGTTAAAATLYTTAWANLTGWSTVSGSPTVSGGKLQPTCVVDRTQALPTSGRLTLAAPLTNTGHVSQPSAIVDLGTALRIRKNAAGFVYVTFGTQTQGVTHTSGTLVAQWNPDGATITTPQGSWVFVEPWATLTNKITCSATGVGTAVPGFTLEDLAADTPFSNSDSTQLDVDEAWLIHPSQPSLSCSIDPGAGNWRDDGINVDIGTKPNLSRRQVATTFNPVGRTRAVVVTHGNRLEGDWTLNLFTPRLQDRDTVQAIITDQTPLLFRAPLDWEWDLPDGWYSVGDVDEARSFPGAGLQNNYRNIVLPLTPVDPPIVRQGALWTWGDVLVNYATWQDVLDAFPTWLDLLAGPSA